MFRIRALVRGTILEELSHEIFFVSDDCGGTCELISGRDSQTDKSVDHFTIPLSFCVSGVMSYHYIWQNAKP
jgi:hypothetical protein